MPPKNGRYVGRGGEKLKFTIDQLGLDLRGTVAADFGCNVGGFTDCLLQEGARHVYAVDTGYGALEWKLRCDERVTVMERTNAMHVVLPEAVDVVAVDVGWTRQRHILPNALKQLKPAGLVLSLFKPQYEADRSQRRRGRILPESYETVLEGVLRGLEAMGITISEVVHLPEAKGSRNPEAFLCIDRGFAAGAGGRQ